jgi:hypothetical protein
VPGDAVRLRTAWMKRCDLKRNVLRVRFVREYF